jgi:hypothetical protein
MSHMTTEELLEKYPRPWAYEGVVPWEGAAKPMYYEIVASNGTVLSGPTGKRVRFEFPPDLIVEAVNVHLVLGNNSQPDSVESRG